MEKFKTALISKLLELNRKLFESHTVQNVCEDTVSCKRCDLYDYCTIYTALLKEITESNQN